MRRLANLNLSDDNKEALKELLEEAEVFRTTGIANNNGADSYRCPCCFGSRDIQGNAFSYGTLDESEHDENCTLNQLYKDLYGHS